MGSTTRRHTGADEIPHSSQSDARRINKKAQQYQRTRNAYFNHSVPFFRSARGPATRIRQRIAPVWPMLNRIQKLKYGKGKQLNKSTLSVLPLLLQKLLQNFKFIAVFPKSTLNDKLRKAKRDNRTNYIISLLTL